MEKKQNRISFNKCRANVVQLVLFKNKKRTQSLDNHSNCVLVIEVGSRIELL